MTTEKSTRPEPIELETKQPKEIKETKQPTRWRYFMDYEMAAHILLYTKLTPELLSKILVYERPSFKKLFVRKIGFFPDHHKKLMGIRSAHIEKLDSTSTEYSDCKSELKMIDEQIVFFKKKRKEVSIRAKKLKKDLIPLSFDPLEFYTARLYVDMQPIEKLTKHQFSEHQKQQLCCPTQ